MLIQLRPSLGRALVVGAGTVGRRKIARLRADGFATRVVDPALDLAWAEAEELEGIRAPFEPVHLRDTALVFACTNDRRINEWVGLEARARGLPVLVADAPEESSFFSVATLHHGELEIGVSTRGKNPAGAKAFRDQLKTLLPERPE